MEKALISSTENRVIKRLEEFAHQQGTRVHCNVWVAGGVLGLKAGKQEHGGEECQ